MVNESKVASELAFTFDWYHEHLLAVTHGNKHSKSKELHPNQMIPPKFLPNLPEGVYEVRFFYDHEVKKEENETTSHIRMTKIILLTSEGEEISMDEDQAFEIHDLFRQLFFALA